MSLDPKGVEARLALLRELYVAETVDDAAARIDDRVADHRPFAEQVASRLAELSALCELARYLHSRA